MIQSLLVFALATLSLALPNPGSLTSMGGPEVDVLNAGHSLSTTPANIVGTHEVFDEAGEPVVKGAVTTTVITATGPFTYEGKVFIDRGNGPVEYPSEQIVIVGGFDGYYAWTNTAGSGGSGTITETGQGAGGNHDSEVTSGPSKGKKRHFVKQ